MDNKIKFIDLFCGIGGFRLGLEANGFECVFSADINKHACEMYKYNFGDDPTCDITTLDSKTLPNFDVLCGGFPCQAFSSAGKKMGFNESRGTLFFDVLRILQDKNPKAFILENVKNLKAHDGGKTFKVIYESLVSLGYNVSFKILNARDFGVAQNRERIILVGLKDGLFNFEDIEYKNHVLLDDSLDVFGIHEYLDKSEYTLIDNPKKQGLSGLEFVGYRNKNIRKVGVRAETLHLSRVHKQPNRIYSVRGTNPTLSAQEISGRYFILDIENRVRKLTLNECYRLMGFPNDFKKVGSNSSLYRCIGNSVCVPMIGEVARVLKKLL